MIKRALLFGMNKYRPSNSIQANDLMCTTVDVNTLKKKLIQIDFEVTSFFDLSIDDMKKAVSSFADAAPCDSINIIYFSGHGGHCKGQNYVYPVDFGQSVDNGKSIEQSAFNIREFSNAFVREVKLIIIIDACRSDLTPSYNYGYSEMFAPKNTYIAYATQFSQPSLCNQKISYFTESICENILTPNITVDELFTTIRASLYLKYSKQISNSVNGFMKYDVTLNTQAKIDDIGVSVCKFVDRFGNMYIDKYGCFAGDDLVFIDAAQYCNISVLDAIFKYSVIDGERCHVTTSLTEAHIKLIAFWNMLNHGLKQDEFYTWQYRGRPIRLGEILPLPLDMQKPMPDIDKAIDVRINVNKNGNKIDVMTNLPDKVQFYGTLDEKYHFSNVVVENGKAIIPIPENIDNPKTVKIYSVALNLTEVDNEIVGDRARNLVGQYIKFDPIHGNMIEFHSEIK